MDTTKRDIFDLRRRMTRKDCTFDRLCGCYVNGERQVVLKFNELFANLEDEEYLNYLEIAKKVLSGSLGGNLLELGFEQTEEGSERQKDLYALKASKLKSEEMLDQLYEEVMRSYTTEGNYLILLFHDVYDVITRTSDNIKLDESSEVYEYMICAVCPVEFTKPDLGYKPTENRIGVLARNGIIGQPEIGFLYPAFIGRSADTNTVLYYVKTGKSSHAEFMESALRCVPQRTVTEDKAAFRSVIEETFVEDPAEAERVYLEIQKNLSELARQEEDATPVKVTKAVMDGVLIDAGVPPEAGEKLGQAFTRCFQDAPPAENLLDKKLMAKSGQTAHAAELEQQVSALKQQLAQKSAEKAPEDDTLPWTEETSAEVVLHLPAAKASQVRTEMVNGHRCLIVPFDEGESARINGVETEF